jgi:hypothetical protein
LIAVKDSILQGALRGSVGVLALAVMLLTEQLAAVGGQTAASGLLRSPALRTTRR